MTVHLHEPDCKGDGRNIALGLASGSLCSRPGSPDSKRTWTLRPALAYSLIGMAADTFDRLLTALAVRLHAFSVCDIQRGWRLAFPSFEAITVHYVLEGSGALRVGNPGRQSHVMGHAGDAARTRPAKDHRSLLADGLVTFTAGDGSRDILLLCGAIPAFQGSALGLFDLLREPMVETLASSGLVARAFDLMRAEIASPGLGTQAMAEALMKQCLIALLRQHLLRDGPSSPLFKALHHPRLARAVLAVIEDPAAAHSVEGLAARAGMSRAFFADQFSKAFQQGPIDFVQKSPPARGSPSSRDHRPAAQGRGNERGLHRHNSVFSRLPQRLRD